MNYQYYIQIIFALFVLIAIFWGITALSKIFREKRYSGEINILDRLPIDHNSSLLIVQVNNQKYFLSLSNKELKLLDKIN